MKTNQQENIQKYAENVAKGLIEQTPKYMGATFRGLISQVPVVGPSNSKFEKSGGISGGQRVKWLKHKIKKVLPAIKDKIGSKSA